MKRAKPVAIGIDTYHGDAPVDYHQAVQEGISFVYLKLGQGRSYDPAFSGCWRRAGLAGIIRGAYWFFDSRFPAQDQARLIGQSLGVLSGSDLPVALDFETNPGRLEPEALAQEVHRCLEAIHRSTGKLPLIYTGPSFWESALPKASQEYLAARYALWVAHYTTEPAPRLPHGWKEWTFWQYTGGEEGNGLKVGGGPSLDSSRFRGDRSILLAYASDPGGGRLA